jgi:hypothetical protein
MSASSKTQPLTRSVISFPLSECPLGRIRYKVYASATLASAPPHDDIAVLVGATTVRQTSEFQKPGDRLIAIIEAPELSFAHGDDFFMNRRSDHMKFEGQNVSEDRPSNPENSSFTLVALRAHEALEASGRGELDMTLIWAAPGLQHFLRPSVKPLSSIHHVPKR